MTLPYSGHRFTKNDEIQCLKTNRNDPKSHFPRTNAKTCHYCTSLYHAKKFTSVSNHQGEFGHLRLWHILGGANALYARVDDDRDSDSYLVLGQREY